MILWVLIGFELCQTLSTNSEFFWAIVISFKHALVNTAFTRQEERAEVNWSI